MDLPEVLAAALTGAILNSSFRVLSQRFWHSGSFGAVLLSLLSVILRIDTYIDIDIGTDR